MTTASSTDSPGFHSSQVSRQLRSWEYGVGILRFTTAVAHTAPVSPPNVITTLNVIPTVNVTQINAKCNTNRKCNKT